MNLDTILPWPDNKILAKVCLRPQHPENGLFILSDVYILRPNG